MDFMQALKLMKEGKKVKREAVSVFYLILVNGSITYRYIGDNNDVEEQNIRPIELQATDWEEFKEQDDWKLESRGFKEDNNTGTFGYDLDDIKKLKQKILEDIDVEDKDTKGTSVWKIKEIINKRFGF